MMSLSIAVVIVLISLCIAYKIILMSKKGDDVFEQRLPRYGFFYDSEIPDERFFETFEPVYWCGHRYHVLGFETCDLTKRTILTISRHHSLYVRAVDSREVKKIIKGEQS